MTKKELEAKEFLKKLKSHGCTVKIVGQWIKFEPFVPAELILEASNLGDELYRLLKNEAA